MLPAPGYHAFVGVQHLCALHVVDAANNSDAPIQSVWVVDMSHLAEVGWSVAWLQKQVSAGLFLVVNGRACRLANVVDSNSLHGSHINVPQPFRTLSPSVEKTIPEVSVLVKGLVFTLLANQLVVSETVDASDLT